MVVTSEALDVKREVTLNFGLRPQSKTKFTA